jgi:DNA-binding Lrp family transcriptional regulator
MLDAIDFLLVNPWQRGFPLEPRPFATVARKAGVAQTEALARYASLKQQGVIDRIGPVFRPNTVGASTLAAMAVPAERLERVARLVSAQAGVNHNYEREHGYNLWFVATGASAGAVHWTLECIRHATGLEVLAMPLLEEFHIDLGFDLESRAAPRTEAPASFPPLSPEERRLVAATSGGFPLVNDPYAQIGAGTGMREEDVLRRLGAMLADGRIRRIGAVVRHRRLGYEANAMAVWDVPDEQVCGRGQALAREPGVTLCYRRARALPAWPYNLYCMVHGRDRDAVAGEVERLGERHGLAGYPRAVLFSRRCFSQRAARYA